MLRLMPFFLVVNIKKSRMGKNSKRNRKLREERMLLNLGDVRDGRMEMETALRLNREIQQSSSGGETDVIIDGVLEVKVDDDLDVYDIETSALSRVHGSRGKPVDDARVFD